MSSEIRQLEILLEYPNENLEREYKNWLDLSAREGQADLAKAIIALARARARVMLVCKISDQLKDLKTIFKLH